MADVEDALQKLLRRQAALADFGSFAFRETDLPKILAEASRICAESFDVPFCKVCRYRTPENDLLVEAGFGWNAGVVGHVVSRADRTSPQGRAFITGEPVIAEDLRIGRTYVLPPFYAEHGIVSTVDVLIKGNGGPYGVLEVDSPRQHTYDHHDIAFLTGFANVLAEAVATSKRTKLLHATIEEMKALVVEKDRLIDEKTVLAEELQHRVRNNLHLVYGMLMTQADQSIQGSNVDGLRAIARRIMTLAQVYDQLLGTGMTRTIDFGKYLGALCLRLIEFQGSDHAGVRLVCDADAVALDLDNVTVLGIIVAELVANSYDHAFPDGAGTITVGLRGPGAGATAVMTVGDDGTGFVEDKTSRRHGLAVVRRLVQQVRGTLELSSGLGTAWVLRFPVAPALG